MSDSLDRVHREYVRSETVLGVGEPLLKDRVDVVSNEVMLLNKMEENTRRAGQGDPRVRHVGSGSMVGLDALVSLGRGTAGSAQRFVEGDCSWRLAPNGVASPAARAVFAQSVYQAGTD